MRRCDVQDGRETVRSGRTGVWDTARGIWIEPLRAAGTAGAVEEEVRYFLGLDLGQAADYTALATVRRTGGAEARYEVVGLKRFALGTAYAAIVESVSALLGRAPLNGPKTKLLVDATGVGMPVVEMFRRAGMKPVAVIMTAGATATCVDAYRWHVPKRELVSALQLPLQAGRLKVSGRLAEAATLQREMLSFRVRITAAANDTYAAWREGEHDDTVLAVALATWAGEALRKRQLRVY
jgi:hypothetical protein